jgi:hypothetical protein
MRLEEHRKRLRQADYYRQYQEESLKVKERRIALGKVVNEDFVPAQLVSKQTRRIVKTYSHNGVYQLFEIEGCEAWSCCMNRVKESPGCVVQRRDLDRWQLLSIT